MKRKRPKTYEAEHAGRKVRVTIPERQEDDAPGTAERIANHPMFSPTDLAYFRRKGYGDAEILAFWDRDHAAGQKPVRHDKADDGLREALCDNLAPQAVAAIVAFLQPQRYGPLKPDEPTASAEVNAQVAWFVERLTEMVGGDEQVKQLLGEVGL